MSRNIFFGIEYLDYTDYNNNKKNLEFKCLEEDIGQIIPLIIRDEADDLLNRSPEPLPGDWFKSERTTKTTYYFMLSSVNNLANRLRDLAEVVKDDKDSYDEYLRASNWFLSLPYLVNYLINKKELYDVNTDFIRFVGYIE
jgi:hypothetical protein